MPTPEILKPEVSDVIEHQEEFIVPETLQNSGVTPVQKNFKSQVKDDNGIPVIQTPPTQVVTITPPAPMARLTQQSKGDTTNSLTWLAAFWLRIIKKAMHFGWQIVAGK